METEEVLNVMKYEDKTLTLLDIPDAAIAVCLCTLHGHIWAHKHIGPPFTCPFIVYIDLVKTAWAAEPASS